MSSEIVHVGIEQPVQKRKEILNIAIDTIQALKDFEISRKVSKEKDVYRKHFIQVIKELNNDIQGFKDSMPALHITHPHEERKEEIKLEGEGEIKQIIKKRIRKKTHLDELEDDIAVLREKIAGL